jgi:hypothetical protein
LKTVPLFQCAPGLGARGCVIGGVGFLDAFKRRLRERVVRGVGCRPSWAPTVWGPLGPIWELALAALICCSTCAICAVRRRLALLAKRAGRGAPPRSRVSRTNLVIALTNSGGGQRQPLIEGHISVIVALEDFEETQFADVTLTALRCLIP